MARGGFALCSTYPVIFGCSGRPCTDIYLGRLLSVLFVVIPAVRGGFALRSPYAMCQCWGYQPPPGTSWEKKGQWKGHNAKPLRATGMNTPNTGRCKTGKNETTVGHGHSRPDARGIWINSSGRVMHYLSVRPNGATFLGRTCATQRRAQ